MSKNDETISFDHGAEIIMGTTKFRVEKVTETYTILVPIDDPVWLLRYCAAIMEDKK